MTASEPYHFNPLRALERQPSVISHMTTTTKHAESLASAPGSFQQMACKIVSVLEAKPNVKQALPAASDVYRAAAPAEPPLVLCTSGGMQPVSAPLDNCSTGQRPSNSKRLFRSARTK